MQVAGDFTQPESWSENESLIGSRASRLVLGHEQVVGSLEVGKRADLIVLDRNLFEIGSSNISETRVDLTMLDGRIVFER